MGAKGVPKTDTVPVPERFVSSTPCPWGQVLREVFECSGGRVSLGKGVTRPVRKVQTCSALCCVVSQYQLVSAEPGIADGAVGTLRLAPGSLGDRPASLIGTGSGDPTSSRDGSWSESGHLDSLQQIPCRSSVPKFLLAFLVS